MLDNPSNVLHKRLWGTSWAQANDITNGENKAVNTGGQFACEPATVHPHIHPPFLALFRHPLSTAVFLLSLAASLSLCAFIFCFNLLSFSHPECCQFSSHSAHTFFQSLHLSFPLSASPALFLWTLLEQPDSGKWRDNLWDF